MRQILCYGVQMEISKQKACPGLASVDLPCHPHVWKPTFVMDKDKEVSLRSLGQHINYIFSVTKFKAIFD